ncbi:steroid 17-alpha-hydroxylase/17,20 lyase-like [Ptychodera flava]|uniref:steroid 17-alpha-hydroxylase/17,20 lyase-like n=1 Tax=Ptychodera flava TaxID=63121 RepID=UPI003969CC9D
MVSLTIGAVLGFLSSPTNVLLVVVLMIVIAALWSMRIPSGFPPGPRGLPFIGSIGVLATDPIYKITDLAQKYGDIYSLKVGRQRIIVLNNIELVREALVKKQKAFAGRPTVYSLDLFSERGEDIMFGNFTEKWKTLRKIAHQAIRNYASGHKLENLVTKDAFPRLKKNIEENDGEPFDPQPLLLLVVSNVMATMCFGQNYELDDIEFKDILKFIKDFNESFGNGLLADFVPIFKYIPTNGLREYKKIMNMWLSLIRSKVDDHKIKRQEGNVFDLVDDVLKIQAEAKAAGEDQADSLTDVNVRQIVSDIFIAGIDSTINTMNWCISYLVNYPDVQKKVQEEIDDVVGQRLPVLSDKGKLPYCEAVIHEVMRIRTVAPVALPHETIEDTSVGGYNVPKGTQIWTNLWKLHFDEKYWKEPQKFRPERFLDEDGRALLKQDSFLPFSAGRRVCVGDVLAKNEMLLLLTCLFQQFTFSPPPGKDKPSLEPTFAGLATRCIPYKVVARERISGESGTPLAWLHHS